MSQEIERELFAAVEENFGGAEDSVGAVRDFLPLLGKLLEKAKELLAANPENVDAIIATVLKVYDVAVVKIPTGLGPIFDTLIKAQVRQGIEAILRQALSA